jgi:hypothetical protein
MRIFQSLLVVALLVAALTAQNTPLSTGNYYTELNATYQYVYGTGAVGVNSLGDRSASVVAAGSTDKYVPPATGPAPVQVNCPYNQVYDNILCQCVCLQGFHFEGSDCVLNAVPTATCGKN